MKFRPFCDADFPSFQEFAEKEFGQSHCRTMEFNRHWFHSPWADGWSARVCEDQEGRLGGVFMLITVPALLNGKSIPLTWISNGAMREDLAKGLAGAQLYFWIYRQHPLVGALNGNENSDPINAAMGLNIPGLSMRRFVALHSPACAQLCRPEHRERIAALADASKEVSVPGVRLNETRSCPRDYEALWQGYAADFALTIDRQPAYMAWRYRDAPYLRYLFLEVRNEERLVGLAVGRRQMTPAGVVLRIVDFMAEDDWSDRVWAAVSAHAAQTGAIFTDFIVIGTRQDRFLGAGGFCLADEMTGLNAVPHLLSPVEHRAWHLTSLYFGGAAARAETTWRQPDKVWFTKSDGDRDWPTTYDLQRPGQLT